MSYISMSNIGEVGNLGSQIQQYFSVEAIAAVNNKKLIFPEASKYIMHGLKFADLLDINLNIVSNDSFIDFINVGVDPNVKVDDRVWFLDPNINYNFVTRFDLFYYWYDHIKDRVDNIKFKPQIQEVASSIFNNTKNSDKTISIHVRRGDYLLPQHNHFVQLNTDYYESALSYYTDVKDYQILLFSNDIPWCKDHIGKLHNNISYMENNSDFIDLCIMSLCDHNIIANSSFSWWGAYLNKNPDKKIVCPKNYLQNHELSSIINEHYYPSSWVPI